MLLLLKKTLHTEFISNKIAEQENELEKSLNSQTFSMTDDEIKQCIKEHKMTRPEFRVFATKAIGQGWEETCKETNNCIEASWEGTGLNLNVHGSQDKQWRDKMMEKFAGQKEAKEWNKESYEYSKLRFYTKAFNPTSELPPHPKKTEHDLYPPNMKLPPLPPKISQEKASKRCDENIYKLITEAPEIYSGSNKRGTLYDHFVPESSIINAEINNNNEDNNNDIIDSQSNPTAISSTSSTQNVNDTDNNNNNDKEIPTSITQLKISDFTSTSNTTNSDLNSHKSTSKKPYSHHITFNPKQFRFVGLHNIYGVNCYQLSWIQAFSHVPDLTRSLPVSSKLIYRKATIHGITDSVYYRSLQTLRHLANLCSKINNPAIIQSQDVFVSDPNERIVTITPLSFIASLPQPWNGTRQQDAHEFQMKMIDLITSVTNNCAPPPSTTFEDLCSFSIQTHLTCHQCSHSRISRTETYLTYEVSSIYTYICIYRSLYIYYCTHT